MIKFLDLKAAYLELKLEFDDAYHRVMKSGWYLLGEETQAFEREYAHYCGVDHCLSVANGLDALALSLRSLGIGPGDEVIVPSHTFIATWLAVSQVGARPVPVEIDRVTFNLDPSCIEQAVTKVTKAIIPVHLYGHLANMNEVLEIASRYRIAVLEDAAQSQGARCRTKRSGSFGEVAAHSFYPGKNLGAFSDGGAVTTNDSEVADRVKRLRNYGSVLKYQHEEAGVNSRIDELQAAFLRIRLRHLDGWNARRRRIASQYSSRLQGVPGLSLPVTAEDAEPVWHLYVVRCKKRDELQRRLEERGIETLIHYPIPSHFSGAYHHLGLGKGSLPVAEELAETVLSLPISPHHSEDEIDIVCDAVRKFSG